MKYKILTLIILTSLLQSCGGDPVTNKIFVILYVIPFGIAAYFVGSIIIYISTLGVGDEGGDSATIKRIIIGVLAILLLYNIFNGCS